MSKSGQLYHSELEDCYSIIQDLRQALKECDVIFAEIRLDWTDPRADCKKGREIISKAFLAGWYAREELDKACLICGDIHEGAIPLGCQTGDGI